MSPFILVYIAFQSPADTLDGATVYESGRYVVMINKEKPYNEQQLTIKHELSHILLGHFQNERAKDEEFYLKNYENLDIENDANRYADQMTDDEFSELMKYQIGEAVYL